MLRAREPWEFSLEFMLGESLRGKTFGVVGPGRIGRADGAARRGLRRDALFAGRGDDARARCCATADVVSLHCPLRPRRTT